MIVLTGFILLWWIRHIVLPTTLITFHRCLSIMTGVPVLTILRRHCYISHCKACMILILWKLLTNCPQPIYGKVHIEPILHISRQFRMCPLSALYHSSYILWVSWISVNCAEVSNYPHSDMHQKMFDILTLDSHSEPKFKRTGDTKLVDWYSDMIRMYLLMVYLLITRMSCCITVNHFTALLLSNIWD